MKLIHRVMFAAAVGGLCVLTGTTALATPGNNTVTPLAVGTLTEAVNATTTVPGGRAGVQIRGALNIAVAELTIPPGGTSGWHSHAGPHFEVVKQGTVTEISAKGCKAETLQAGQATYDGRPSDVEIAVNRGSQPVVIEQVFILPKGALPRIDQPAPANCTVSP
jgi:hypothetical protein